MIWVRLALILAVLGFAVTAVLSYQHAITAAEQQKLRAEQAESDVAGYAVSYNRLLAMYAKQEKITKQKVKNEQVLAKRLSVLEEKFDELLARDADAKRWASAPVPLSVQQLAPEAGSTEAGSGSPASTAGADPNAGSKVPDERGVVQVDAPHGVSPPIVQPRQRFDPVFPLTNGAAGGSTKQPVVP